MSPHSTTPPAGNQGHRTETHNTNSDVASIPETSAPGLDQDQLPRAYITHVDLSRNGDTRIVVVKCPNCNKRHTHGWPHNTATPGIRVAHCRTTTVAPAASYVLTQGGEPHGN